MEYLFKLLEKVKTYRNLIILQSLVKLRQLWQHCCLCLQPRLAMVWMAKHWAVSCSN